MNDKKNAAIYFSDLENLLATSATDVTDGIASNIKHTHMQEQTSGSDLQSRYKDLAKWEHVCPEAVSDILTGEHSCECYPDVLSDILEGTSDASDENIHPNIHHQPIDSAGTPQCETLDKIKNELIPRATKGKNELIAQAQKAVSKNSQEKALSDMAEAVPQMLKLMVYGKQLFLFESPIWQLVTIEDLILKLRATMVDDAVVPFLGERAYKELYSKLLTTPELQVKEIEKSETGLQIIPCKDGVYNMETGEIRNALPTDYLFSYIDISAYEIGKGGGEVFEQFVANMSDSDPNIRRLLLEVIGVIVSEYYPKAFFLLLGPKNTGKSQFSAFCESLVGKNFCVSVEGLSSFSDRWTPGELFGKKLCIGHDVPKAVVEAHSLATIKELVGRDMVRGEKKYHNPFYFVNNATLMFASNHKLRIIGADEEDAFLDRVITIPFFHSVPRNQWIPDLGKRLFEERGYIVGQSLQALRALKKRNFVFTKVTADFYDDEPQVNDPVGDFVSQCCQLGDQFMVESEILHQRYLSFCFEQEIPASECAIFARMLANKFPELKHLRNVNGSGKRGFQGIALLNGNGISV